MATGMVAAWIGKGAAAPILASSWVRRSGRSISWKVAKVAASVALSNRSSLTSCEKVLPVELLARAPSKVRLRSLSRATRSGRSEKLLRAGSKSRPPVRGLRSPSKSRAARGLRSPSKSRDARGLRSPSKSGRAARGLRSGSKSGRAVLGLRSASTPRSAFGT